jgi:hypothetical protein
MVFRRALRGVPRLYRARRGAPIDAPVEPRFVELRATCPHCGVERGYRADEVSRQLRRMT